MNKLLEPTEEMIEAGYQKARKGNGILIIYKAMISKSETITKLLAVVEALKFYAHPDTYAARFDMHEQEYSLAEKDQGKKARKAIKDLEE